MAKRYAGLCRNGIDVRIKSRMITQTEICEVNSYPYKTVGEFSVIARCINACLVIILPLIMKSSGIL